MAEDLPRGAVSFVFTDVEGSTRLARALGSRWADVLGAHRDLLREAVARYGGHEIDTQGDSFLFVFAHSRDALLASADAQRVLAAHEWPDGGQVRVRIGIHSGQAQLAEGRYVGPAVHRAARIGAAANGGQVLVSHTTHDLVEDEEALADLTLRDLGEFRLKDFDRPVRLYELDGEGLRRAAPRADRVAWTGRRFVVVGAVVLVAAAVAIPLALTNGGSSAPVVVKPNSVAVVDPQSDRVVDDVPVGFDPSAIAVGSGSVWVSNLADQSVSRLDARTHRVVQTIPVTAQMGAIGVGAGGVWLAAQGTEAPTVTRLEPQSGTVVTTLTHPLAKTARKLPGVTNHHDFIAKGIGFARGNVWAGYTIATSTGLGALLRVDPNQNRIADSQEEAFGVAATTAGLGAVWLVTSAEELVAVSPQTRAVTDTIALSDLPGAVAVGAGAVWVTLPYAQRLVRVRSAGPGLPYAVAGDVRIGKGAAAVAVGAGAVWVANSADGTISKVDAASNRVVATIRVGNAPTGIAFGNGLVWVTVQASSDS